MSERIGSGGPGASAPGLTPPQAIEAERSILAAMMLDQSAIGRAVEHIDGTVFYRSAHGKIFDALVALYNRGENADLITVAEELKKRGDFESVGGAATLGQIMEYATTIANIEHHVRIVHSKAILRRLITATTEIQQQAYAGQDETANILDQAEARIFGITDQRIREGFSSIRDLLKPTFDNIQKLFERKVQVTGVPSGWDDLDKLTSGWQPGDLIILAGRPAMGKCVSYRTLVVDPCTGERLTIEECVRRRMPAVLGIDDAGIVGPRAVSHWIDSGVQPVFRVTTRLGRSIEVTGHHPFLAVDGWTPLHDLAVGDHIAVPRIVPAVGSDESWSLEHVRLLAYFIAEGGLTTDCPHFTTADPDMLADFTRCLQACFPTCEMNVQPDGITYRIARKPEHRTAGVRGTIANPVKRWLTDLELMGRKSDSKRLPSAVWTWGHERLGEFLAVLFSCDGTIYDMNGYPRIEFTVASEGLARDVVHALLRFGIVSKFWQKDSCLWGLELASEEDVARFHERILDKEAPKLPTSLDARSTARLVEGPTSNNGFNLHTNRAIPRERLERYAVAVAAPELERIASEDLYWDEIIEITPLPPMQVYDLTVPEGANFLANDICVHNTSAAMNMAENAAIRHQIPVAVFSLEMSKEQLAMRMLCSAAEVGLHKVRTGFLSNEDWPRLTTGAGLLTQAPIFIDDSPAQSVLEIRAKCRRLKSEGKLGMIVVDYLQLMRSSTPAENRVQEISQISRGLKGLAKELGVPIIALSQLSRAVEQRGGTGRPQLSDLRESGCITADSRVLRADTGAEVTMGELLASGERDIPVWTIDESYRLVPGVMTHVFPSGVKEVFELELASGRRIQASANHPFLTLDGWRRLDRLAVDDRIAVPRRTPEPLATREWPEAEIVMLAHMIGDGCVAPRQPIHYTSADPENLAAVEQAAAHFGITPRRVQQGNWSHVYLPAPFKLTHGKRNPLAAWLDRFGLYGKRSYEKFIPREVFSLPYKQVALFLRHLWATDGCVWMGEGRSSVYYASSSRQLADDVQTLLLRFGIHSRIKQTNKSGYRAMFNVQIMGRDNQLRFVQDIGVHGARGEIARTVEQYLLTVDPSVSADTIPAEIWVRVRAQAEVRGLNLRRLATESGESADLVPTNDRGSSRERLLKVATMIKDEQLQALAMSDLYWDRIVSITSRGEQPVYDATVDNTHNFISNNIILHNSIEQDADVVLFVWREIIYKPDTPEPGKAAIIIAKQRNGPTDDVDLTFLRECTKFVPYSPMMSGETDPGF